MNNIEYTIPKSIALLNRFPFLEEELTSQMQLLNLDNPSSEANIERVENLRIILEEYVSDQRSEYTICAHLSLVDVTYHALISLAHFSPRNNREDDQFIDLISLMPLNPDGFIAFSSGYLYDLDSILGWHVIEITDPATRQNFSIQDRAQLLDAVFDRVNHQIHETDYVIEYSRLKKQRLLAYSLLLETEDERQIMDRLPEARRRTLQEIQRAEDTAFDCLFSLKPQPVYYQTKRQEIFNEFRLKNQANEALVNAMHALNNVTYSGDELRLKWNEAYDAAITADNMTRKIFKLNNKLGMMFATTLCTAGIFDLFAWGVMKDSSNRLAGWVIMVINAFFVVSVLGKSYEYITGYFSEGSEERIRVTSTLTLLQDERLESVLHRNSMCFFQNRPRVIIPDEGGQLINHMEMV